jgi:hypothetical protein
LLTICRVGLDLPTIEVRFEHLQAEAEVRVGTNALPTVLNSITNKLEVRCATYCSLSLLSPSLI